MVLVLRMNRGCVVFVKDGLPGVYVPRIGCDTEVLVIAVLLLRISKSTNCVRYETLVGHR